MTNKLNERQKALKEFLEVNFRSGKFFTIEEICSSVMVGNDFAYSYNRNPYTHDKCVCLSNDVRAINWSMADDYKIIVKDKKGSVKLCENEQEFNEWRDKEMRPVLKKLKYLWNLKYKNDTDGEVQFIDQDGDSIENPSPLDVFVRDCIEKGL